MPYISLLLLYCTVNYRKVKKKKNKKSKQVLWQTVSLLLLFVTLGYLVQYLVPATDGIFSRYKMQGTNRTTGEGGEEPAMWPRIWVTTTSYVCINIREGERKNIISGTWGGERYRNLRTSKSYSKSNSKCFLPTQHRGTALVKSYHHWGESR